MNDDADLTERIKSAHFEAFERYREGGPRLDDRLAAAVLPIVAEEVRAAKAEALREAAGDIVWSAETLPDMTPHDAARGLVRRAARIEQEDQP